MAIIDDSTAAAGRIGFCSSCGEPVGNVRFCPRCGQAIPFWVGGESAPAAEPNGNGAGPPEAAAAPPATAPGRSRRAAIIAAAAVGLAAIAAAAVMLVNRGGTTGNGRSSAGASAARVYRAKLRSALEPVVTADRSLSSTLGAVDGSHQTIHAAKNAAAAAQTAVLTAKGGVNLLNPPASEQTMFQQAQQALDNESGYTQAVSSTLSSPSGSSAAQTLATSLQSSLVPVDALISGASGSVSGTANLVSWANGAAGAAHAGAAHTGATGQTGPPAQTGSTAGPSSGSPAGGGDPYANGSDCGGGLYAGPNTSCAFAQNVQSAYDQAPGLMATVQVYSPVTNQTYTMSCAPAGAGVTCSGANNASVTW